MHPQYIFVYLFIYKLYGCTIEVLVFSSCIPADCLAHTPLWRPLAYGIQKICVFQVLFTSALQHRTEGHEETRHQTALSFINSG